ncbi:hypothetical protein GCM10010277_82490 [Streptomyces longisporoflavus]|nr:hypothetical protein GCM10010277_82490 [Streptomyces longisporoflavus]
MHPMHPTYPIELAAPGGGPDGPPWLGIAFGVVVVIGAVFFAVSLMRGRGK